MRILIVHRVLPFPADNGGKLRAAYLARYLATHHKVELICFADDRSSVEFPEKSIFSDVRFVAIPKPASFVRQITSGTPSEVSNLRSDAMTQQVADAVKHLDPEVILTSDPSMTQYLEPFRDRVRVLDYLMVSTLALERLGILARGWKRLLWRSRWLRSATYQRRIAPLYDLCLVNSQEDYDDLVKHCPGWRRLEFLPNGLPLDEYPLGLGDPESNTIVYPGSVTYISNRDAVEYMIAEILPLIRAEIPGVRFIVTGAIPESGRLPTAEGVEYTGRLPDVRPTIARAQVCAVPLRSGAGGTRFKVLESMALGTPVISTTIGAEGVDWTDGRDISIADNPQTFAAKTVKLLESVELRSSISAAGRQLIERKYDWAVIGDRVSDMLLELVDQWKTN